MLRHLIDVCVHFLYICVRTNFVVLGSFVVWWLACWVKKKIIRDRLNIVFSPNVILCGLTGLKIPTNWLTTLCHLIFFFSFLNFFFLLVCYLHYFLHSNHALVICIGYWSRSVIHNFLFVTFLCRPVFTDPLGVTVFDLTLDSERWTLKPSNRVLTSGDFIS